MRPGSVPPGQGAGARRGWAAGVMCLGLFMLGVDLTVLNVAVPQLRDGLGASTAQVQWVVDGYALVLGGTVLAVGALTDRWGRRRCFVLGVSACALASVYGAVAGEPWQVVLARCGMGAGAALLMPATLGVLHHLFPEPELRRGAIAAWAAVGGLGGLSGPVVGGWLVEHSSWRAAFWINLPLAVVIVAAALLVVPESHGRRDAAFDLAGAALSTCGLLVLVWAVIQAPHAGWTSLTVTGALVLAGALLAAFVGWERRTPSPMLPLELLARPGVGWAAAALALMSFALFGALFVLTLYLQGVLGYSPLAAGVRTLPLPGGLALGAAAAVLTQRRWGVKATVVTGLLVVSGSFVVWATTTDSSGYARCALFQVIAGLGAGLVAAAGTESVMDSVPTERAGLGSSINDATRQVGSALGVAVQGSLLSSVFTSLFVDALAGLQAPRGVTEAARHSLLAVPDQAAGLPPALRLAVLGEARHAFVQAMTVTAALAGAVALLTAVAVAVRLPSAAGRGAGGAPVQPVRSEAGQT
ncbi:MFS transporter [Streptomyces sp. CC224B]|uniref:MFS transporter n=1 Tax=Streptomyces sp. CC224B TaxID=3044571 RepID=UPI0024A83B13|nr:MFS transporter [Streptomyces sp. CC224B]